METYTFTHEQLEKLLLDTLTAFVSADAVYDFSEANTRGEVVKNIINTLDGIAANVDKDNVSESALGLEPVF